MAVGSCSHSIPLRAYWHRRCSIYYSPSASCYVPPTFPDLQISSDMSTLYNRRQDVNIALYDYMQLKQEGTPSGFGCQGTSSGSCHGKVYVFDGSMYGYKRAYNSDIQTESEVQNCVDGVPLELRCLVPRISQSHLKTLQTCLKLGK